MKSKNPHSGFHPVDVSPCLDMNGGSPQSNQGGMVIVEACSVGNGQIHDAMHPSEKARTLNNMHDQQAILVGGTDGQYLIRRLTPLECCRLQGFPDWWEDGVEGSDSARYRMWGNGVALPCVVDVLARIVELSEGDVTCTP